MMIDDNRPRVNAAESAGTFLPPIAVVNADDGWAIARACARMGIEMLDVEDDAEAARYMRLSSYAMNAATDAAQTQGILR